MAKNKPELLLPAGNTESFYAALRGGADAVFLGLKSFNARGRAMNFSNAQLLAAVQEAKKRNVKLYVTLNTVLKNAELKEVIDVLSFLVKARVDAVIIQDWGVYYIARHFFPGLKIHASTQMGNHNSLGVNYNSAKGISRTILARELTMTELQDLSSRVNSEIELFVHGALCYSFSGMCLFSSYQGGQGANRGMCAQPCRMVYKDNEERHCLFSLKDNQQVENLDQLIKCKVNSLKVEGRMKSADYVFHVAQAYRFAIDHPQQIEHAVEMLKTDMGREKISYFLGHDVKDGITADSNTGIEIGQLQSVSATLLKVKSKVELSSGNRLRILSCNDDSSVTLKLNPFRLKNGVYEFQNPGKTNFAVGDRVFLVGLGNEKFPSKFKVLPKEPNYRWSFQQKQKIYNCLYSRKYTGSHQLFVRIDNPDWLRKINFTGIDALILKFKKGDWERTDWQQSFLQENRKNIWIELPKFISEEQLEYYEKNIRVLCKQGLIRFFVNHLSQKELLPPEAIAAATENVYVYNDAAARMLQDEDLQDYCYPMENDIDNLLSMKNKNGIVPVYFYPELFYSRMPVRIEQAENKFKDESGKLFRKFVRDGITIVVPDIPVSFTQYKKRLDEAGFRKFLIDFSYCHTNGKLIKKIITRFDSGEQVHPSTTFNFKKGLK